MQESKRPGDRDEYEYRLRDALKFLSYAPVLFVSAAAGKGTEKKIFPRVGSSRFRTPQANQHLGDEPFLKSVDFERATVPLSRESESIHDASLGFTADLHHLYRQKGEAALLLPAISRESDPQSFRLRRNADLDQEPRQRVVKGFARTPFKLRLGGAFGLDIHIGIFN